MCFMNSSKGHTVYISVWVTPFLLFISSLKLDMHYLYTCSLFSYEIEVLLPPSYDFCGEIRVSTWKFLARCLTPGMRSIYQLLPSFDPFTHVFPPFHHFLALLIQPSIEAVHRKIFIAMTPCHLHDWITGSKSRKPHHILLQNAMWGSSLLIKKF